MLLIDIHELDIVFTKPITLAALEDQVDYVGSVFRLQCQDVLILRASQHLHQRAKVDPQCDISITAEGREGLGF